MRSAGVRYQEYSSDFEVMSNLYNTTVRRGTKYGSTCIVVAVRDEEVQIIIIRSIQNLHYYDE